MRELLLIDVALWSALIMVAALIIIGRWRSRHSGAPAYGRRREAIEPAGRKMSPRKTAPVTGLSEDIRKPDRAAPRPARPAPTGDVNAAQRPARPAPTAPPPAADVNAAPRPARPAPTAPPQTGDVNAAQCRPGTQRAGRQPPRRAATTPSEQIAGYYDQADQPIADYLAALGWIQQPRTPPGRATGADGDSAADPRGGRPAP